MTLNPLSEKPPVKTLKNGPAICSISRVRRDARFLSNIQFNEDEVISYLVLSISE